MNRTPPQAQLLDPKLAISAEQLAVIGTLARTYDQQRRRLIALRLPSSSLPAPSPLRPLPDLEPAVAVDGVAVSASIVDAVVQAAKLAGSTIPLPIPKGADPLGVAEAGWWDALLGDVERRTGLAPRSIGVALDPEASPAMRAVFADRIG